MSSRHPVSGWTITDRQVRRASLMLGVGAAAVWVLMSAGGCASYSSERSQFESRRMTVHAVSEAPSRSSARVASVREGE